VNPYAACAVTLLSVVVEAVSLGFLVGFRLGKDVVAVAFAAVEDAVVVEDGRVKRRKVELGYVSLNIVEVIKGLKAGELVIVEDIDKYREGDRVNTEVVK
jgi:hypothetical protein